MDFQEAFNTFNANIELSLHDNDGDEVVIDNAQEYFDFDEGKAETAWVEFLEENNLETGLQITLEVALKGETYEGVALCDIFNDITIMSWHNGHTSQFKKQFDELEDKKGFLNYISDDSKRVNILEYLVEAAY